MRRSDPVPSPDQTRPYHHGNLRNALIDAAVELAREGGPDAIVLREVGRRVGVSHNAAYRHFPDRDALLTAVCARAMASLARLMEHEVAPFGADAAGAGLGLMAIGRAYVRFAVSEPGLFRTAFAIPEGHALAAEEGVGDSGLAPLSLLGRQLDRLVDAGAMDPARRPGAEFTAWSAVHGMSTLRVDGPLRELPPADADAATERLLADIARGLLADG